MLWLMFLIAFSDNDSPRQIATLSKDYGRVIQSPWYKPGDLADINFGEDRSNALNIQFHAKGGVVYIDVEALASDRVAVVHPHYCDRPFYAVDIKDFWILVMYEASHLQVEPEALEYFSYSFSCDEPCDENQPFPAKKWKPF